MSKPWKPGREAVALRPSRIRRDPVRTLDKIEPPSPPSPEREVWGAVAGVLVIAAGCTALVVGLSQVTSYTGPVAAAERAEAAAEIGHCGTRGGSDCVLDGDTLFIAGQRVDIAGIDAPEIHPARCREEARRGIQAAVRLHELVNRGAVTLVGAGSGDGGPARPIVSKVEVDGLDVGSVLVGAGLARTDHGVPGNWC